MIEKYVSDIAIQMGIELSEVSLTDGSMLGCKDVHLLDIASEDSLVSTLVFHTDLTNLRYGYDCARLEIKVRKALSRLQVKNILEDDINR